MDYPRVLFVTSAAFNSATGGGITFSNLFRGWPSERLFTIHNDEFPVSFDVCKNYFRLGTAEIGRWPHLISGTPGRVEREGEKGAQAGPSRGVAMRSLRRLLVGAPWPDRGCVTPALARYIEQARPELVYTILGTLGMTELVREIRDRFHLPVVPHFMDDYISTLYSGGMLSWPFRDRLRVLTSDIVSNASRRLAIGDEMAAAYAKRWGQSFESIQNAVDVVAIQPADPVRHMSAPFKLAYVGSIFPYAQSESLIDIAAAVARLADAGWKISLDVYSPLHLAEAFRPRLEIHPSIRLQDTISDDTAFFRALGAVDALVLPVNFDTASVAYIRYSMPTKVPAYLASGTPILAYGPLETAQISYAQREGWGMVVERRDPGRLDQALRTLATDNALRRRLSEQARKVATRHDVGHVRNKFQAILIQAAENEANSS